MKKIIFLIIMALTTFILSAQLIPPTLSPNDNATGVSVSPTLTMTFESHSSISLTNNKTIYLFKTDGSSYFDFMTGAPPFVPRDPRISISGNQLSFDLSSNTLDYSTEYTLIALDSDIILVDGTYYYNDITNPTLTTWTFTTEAAPTPPTISSYNPADDAITAQVDQTLELTFGENIQTGSGYLTIYESGVGIFETLATGQVSVSGATLQITHNTFAENTAYYILMDAGFVESVASSTPASAITDATQWNFVTESQPNISTYLPLQGASNVPVSQTLQLTFDEDIVLGTGNFQIFEEGVGQFQTFNELSSEITVSTNTVSITHNDFDAQTTYYILIDAGLIVSDATATPFSGITDANQWKFTTPAPPTILSLSPDDGSTGVALDQLLNITFSENMQVGAGNLTIYETGVGPFQTLLTSQVTIIGSNLQITHNNFAQNTDYHILIDDGFVSSLDDSTPYGGITDPTTYNFQTETLAPTWTISYPNIQNITKTDMDIYGQTDQNGTYYFVITSNATPPSIAQILLGDDETDSPAAASGNGAMTADTEFSDNTDISSLNSETIYYVHIFSRNAFTQDSNIASKQFTTLDTQAPTYTVGYPTYTNLAGTSVTLLSALNESGTSYYVIVPTGTTPPTGANVIAGENGDSNPAFRSGNIPVGVGEAQKQITGLVSESDYTVYIVTSDAALNYLDYDTPTTFSFTTLDITAPTAVLSPTNAETDVLISTAPTIIYTEKIYIDAVGTPVTDLNVASLITFKENGPIGPNVTFTATYNDGSNTITITPSAALDDQFIYYYALTNVYDLSGNQATTYNAYFETEDLTAPIPTFSPLDGATSVNISTDVIITFDEPIYNIDASVIDNTNVGNLVTLQKNPGQQVTCTVTINAEKTIITMTPTNPSPLEEIKTYDLIVDPVEDIVGNEMTQTSISWTTGKTNIWNGSNSSDWTDNGNWDGSYANNNAVVIPSTAPNFPIIATTGSIASSFTIEPGASLTIDPAGSLTVSEQLLLQSNTTTNASIIGEAYLSIGASKVKVNQIVTNSDYYYPISSPVSGATKNSIDCDGVMYSFNPTTGSYVPHTGTDALEVTKSYLLKSSTNLSFEGALNYGNQTANVSRSTKNAGWNLIGNPYASAIDFNLLSLSNVNDGFWLWLSLEGLYGTYNGVLEEGTNLGAAPMSEIPSMHGFWVQVILDQTTGSVGFSEAARMHNSKTLMKSAALETRPIIRLTGYAGAIGDETLITSDDLASDSYDEYDSEKRWASNKNLLELYTVADNKSLTINGIHQLAQEQIIPLGIKTGTESTGEYTISLSQLANLEEYTIKLVDKTTGKTIDLTQVENYTFSESVDVNRIDRFQIKLASKNTTTVNKSEKHALFEASVNNHLLRLKLITDQDATYQLFNISGKLIRLGELNFSTDTKINIEDSGVYIIKVFSHDKSETQKVLMK